MSIDTNDINWVVDGEKATAEVLNRPGKNLLSEINTELNTELNKKADKTTKVVAGTGLSGGGTLESDRTLSVKYGTAAGTAVQGNAIVQGTGQSTTKVMSQKATTDAIGKVYNPERAWGAHTTGNWAARSVVNSTWNSVTWSPELGMFVAVATTGTNQVMTSTDGVTWSPRLVESSSWNSVTWSPELGMFAAVADDGTNRVMTSTNGITWTPRSVESSSWRSVTWSPELGMFVAVAGHGSKQVMTSTNGVNWTPRTVEPSVWLSVTWSPELGMFVAVAASGTNQIMTSTNGITWSPRSAESSSWYSVTWSPELGMFVAVAASGTNRVMTSTNGITWTPRSVEPSQWQSVTWSPELGMFVAVASSGTNRVMTSTNGITWTPRLVESSSWNSVSWSPELGMFVAVAYGGTNRVMTTSGVSVVQSTGQSTTDIMSQKATTDALADKAPTTHTHSWSDITDKPETATKAEAEAGSINTTYMTPLRTKEAILKLAPAPDLSNYLPLTGGTVTGNLTVSGTNEMKAYHVRGTHGITSDQNITAELDIHATRDMTCQTLTASTDVVLSSDRRLKDNFKKIEDSLNKVLKLNGYTYDRTDIDCKRQTGLVAQEVQEVLPEAVSTDKNGYLGVAYGNMVGLLVEAIKEQQVQIDELKKLNRR